MSKFVVFVTEDTTSFTDASVAIKNEMLPFTYPFDTGIDIDPAVVLADPVNVLSKDPAGPSEDMVLFCAYDILLIA